MLPAQLPLSVCMQCLGRVFDDEIDYLSQWRIIDVFLTQSLRITYEGIRELELVFVNWYS